MLITGVDFGFFDESATVYGRIDEQGQLVITHPRWMALRRVISALVPYAGPVVTAIDRDDGVITVGRG